MPVPRSSRVVSCLLLVGGLCCASVQALNVRVLVSAGATVTVRVPLAGAGQTSAPSSLGPSTGAASGLTAPAGVPAPAQLAPVAWRIGVQGSGAAARLTLSGQDSGNATLYLPPSPGSLVEISGKTYRGGVFLRIQNGGVQAINVLDVEDYLRGVVAAEMPASWPSAALAAQAVIARTYVTARINPALPFDTCATESCQVYTGLAAEKPQTDAAIAATRGQVVAYGGKPARTYFSSDSGGFTASSAEVWGSALPYLTAKPDPFSAGGPRSQWRLEVPLSKVQDVAARYGVRVGTLGSVVVSRQSESGRPQELTLSGSSGTARLSGAEAGGFVRSLGAASSRVQLSGQALSATTPLVIEGAGAGHGVGLSQYGALGLARQGYSHLHVLGFYYPGTVLSALAGTGEGLPLLAGAAALPMPSSTVGTDTLALSGSSVLGRPSVLDAQGVWAALTPAGRLSGRELPMSGQPFRASE